MGQFKGKSRELSHYEFCPRKENNISHFPNQRCIGNFMSQRKERGEKREERRETRDEIRDTRDEGRETRDKRREAIRRETRYEIQDTRYKIRETRNQKPETRNQRRESERIKEQVVIFLNRPGQNEKSANFRGKSGVVCI